MRRAFLLPVTLLALSAAPLTAQLRPDSGSSPSPAREKNPTTASLIGIIPGAGHMYAGEARAGGFYLGVTLGLAALASAVVVADCVDDLFQTEECGSNSGATALAVVAGSVWVWSIYDAGRAARRTNARRGLRPSVILEPARTTTLAGRNGRGVRVGLSFATR